jgi:hypothetical protein
MERIGGHFHPSGAPLWRAESGEAIPRDEDRDPCSISPL